MPGGNIVVSMLFTSSEPLGQLPSRLAIKSGHRSLFSSLAWSTICAQSPGPLAIWEILLVVHIHHASQVRTHLMLHSEVISVNIYIAAIYFYPKLKTLAPLFAGGLRFGSLLFRKNQRRYDKSNSKRL